jgi:ABC-2 type transport system ATP-binding protein
VEIRGLRKTFKGSDALSGIDLDVPEGSIFGFLGPNGAGKTTTIRILMGLARSTGGQARVFGHDVRTESDRVRSLVGFLPDVPGYYPWMTAEKFLRLSGKLYGVTGKRLDERVDSLLESSGLADVQTRIGGYSRGMKQRLGVAQALVSSPRLLILDEPTSALDPIGRKHVLEMIGALRGSTTVFFSTHILGDVERVCDSVAILDRGRVIEQASIAELKRSSGRAVLVLEVAAGAEVLERALCEQCWLTGVEREGQTLKCRVSDMGEARNRIPRMVADGDLSIVRMEADEPTLEDIFVRLVGGAA